MGSRTSKIVYVEGAPGSGTTEVLNSLARRGYCVVQAHAQATGLLFRDDPDRWALAHATEQALTLTRAVDTHLNAEASVVFVQGSLETLRSELCHRGTPVDYHVFNQLYIERLAPLLDHPHARVLLYCDINQGLARLGNTATHTRDDLVRQHADLQHRYLTVELTVDTSCDDIESVADQVVARLVS